MEKMRWIIITKTTIGVIFNLQNSHSLTLSLPTEAIFQVNGQIGLWQIFQMSIFVLSRDKCHCQSHLIRNFRFFFSYIGFLHLVGKFECHCLYTNWFFSVLAAIIWEDSDKLPWIKNGEGFAVHSSAWPSGAKGEWRSAADWWYQTHVKKYRIITAFLGAGNPCTTP